MGGADYGSVRIGTFMGRKMIKSTAFHNSKKVEGLNNNGKDEDGMDLLEVEAAMDYLSNISPHRLYLLFTFDTNTNFFLMKMLMWCLLSSFSL